MQPFGKLKETSVSILAGEALVLELPPIDSFPESEVIWIVDGQYLFGSQKHVVTLKVREAIYKVNLASL